MMELSLVVFLLVLAVPVISLPLIGKKWSAIVSYVIFGAALGLGLFGGWLMLSEPPAGPSHQFGWAYLVMAAIAAAIMLLTFFVYRYRRGKNPANLLKK